MSASQRETASVRMGVVGTGSFGRNHVRILSTLPGVELLGIYDQRPEIAAALAAEHGTESFTTLEELAAAVDAAVLAVPTFAHAELGCELLGKGVDLLIEKPISLTLAEADRLLEAASGRILAVGHVEFYNPAVQALLAIDEAARFIEIQRLSPFTPRSLDIDVLLDLMIHDLQILHALDPSPVREIRATGIEVLSPKIDIASARIAFESGLVANVTTSRVSAESVRKLRAYLKSRYFSIDYRDQEIKGFGLREEGDRRVITPVPLEVEPREPLVAELEAFAAACRGERVAYVDGRQGRRALETALAVREAIGK